MPIESPRTRKSITPRLGRLAVACSLVLVACGAPAPRPDIVLVTLDCLRADRLAAYGGSGEATPNLDRLAARGTVFDRAYTAIGTTFPSHTTMLTGLYPRAHGVRRNGHRLPEETTTVAELLKAVGYRTGSFVAYGQMHYLGNLKQGFDVASDAERPAGRQGKRDGGQTVRLAIDWLESLESESGAAEADAPIFLWVHLFDAHGPYRLNPYSRQRLAGYEGPLADGASMDELIDRVPAILRSPESRRALQILYEGEVAKMDRHVGQLIEAVEALGRDNGTVWLVAADHGQGLGEGGRMGHGPVLWEEVLRVPLIVADSRADTVARAATTVGLVDVTPTILDLAGFEKLPPLQGRSLVPALERGELPAATYYSEVKVDDRGASGAERLAVYETPYKLEYETGKRNRLFELIEEPPGVRPLKPTEYRDVYRRMSELATEFLAQESKAHETELTPDDIETLRALGYVE